MVESFFSCIIIGERGQGMSQYHLRQLYKKARIQACNESIKSLERKKYGKTI